MDGVLAQERVREYWDRRPCDAELSARERGSREFYLDVERERYAQQPHILQCLARIAWRDKRALEVGAGIGTDARRIIAAGACYTGINVDRGSADAAARALRVFNLPGLSLQCDARALEFPDETFDVVYSFGVLPHIPAAERAVAEIERVLKPGGELLVMLYNRSSINYVLEIMLLRKIGLRLLGIPGMIAVLGLLGLPRAKLARHWQVHRQHRAVSPAEWLGRNCHGPDCPYCRVYSAREAAALFARFKMTAQEVHFFDHRHWGVIGALLPRPLRRRLGRRWGWHRILIARKPAAARAASTPEARA